jgi:adenylate kinase family enzyme
MSSPEAKMPLAVKDKDKLNVILYGPDKAGKTSVANLLSQEHQRCIVKLDQLYDFCVKRGLPVADKAAKYLEQRQEELKLALEEQEKAKKAKGKKPPAKGQEEPEVNPNDYKYLSKEIVIEMVQARVQEEDCNAGVIFDNLEAPQW